MPTAEYKVTLDAFEGPLDLLLYLIRRAEVDITDIPVSTITGQYLDFLKAGGGIERMDIEAAGEFLVMAATLMEIKSRMLMPPEAQVGPDGEPIAAESTNIPAAADPRADLVKQLLAYKRFRDAAHALEERRGEWERRFPAGAAGAPQVEIPEEALGDIDLGDLELVHLVSAFAQIMETVDFNRVGDHRVLDDETPIEVHAADIIDLLNREGREAEGAGGAGKQMEFRELFRGRSRSEAIGLFLAMLELIRQQQVRVRQEQIHGTILLELPPKDDASKP
ncbi:MAG: segregation and condensation protein A [Phycisphaerales bacterium]